MEIKLESLIEKIKKDGIEQAKRAAQEIIQNAERKAKDIVGDARDKAEKILAQAEEDSRKLKSNTEASLRQAGRDLVLSLKEQIVALFERMIKDKVREELSPDFMQQLILKLVDNWSIERQTTLEVLVSKEDKKKLEQLLSCGLKNQAKHTVEIKVARSVDKGFRIGIKGEDVYYDFTDESILESLKEFLNPAISKMLDAN